jgi:spermidine synthase
VPSRLLAPLVFVVGAASLGAEIAAARLLAPYFGASTIVWANTIATVLVALSVGYWIGGRLADRRPRLDGLCGLVLAASALLAAVPFLAGPFLGVSVDALDSVSAGAFVGSLVAVLTLIALPVLLLGAASPYAVRLALKRVDEAGRVTGRLYAISTAGALAGTFLSALVLVPFVGTRRTFLTFALALAVVSVLGLRARFRVAPVLLVGLLLLPVGGVKAKVPDGGRVVDERETEYQYARVVQEPDGDRRLELNEGRAVHSVYAAGRWLTGDYWDGLLLDGFTARRGLPRRVAILGNAGGTTARAYGHYFPRTRVDAVEIDGELSALGRRWFALRGPRLHVVTEDARPFVRRAARASYDAIVLDAYRQPYVPFYLLTREFFAEVRDRLTPHGALVINVGHPKGSGKLERVVAATMRAVFPTVVRDPIRPTNTIVIGSGAPGAGAARLHAAADGLPRALRAPAARAAARIGPPPRGGEVYTDDRAPVEWLIDASILRYAAEGGR